MRYDPDELEEKLALLLEKIPMVFITEYFDESLVLLKRIMCWDMKDIIYSKLKTGSYRNYLYENRTFYKELYFKDNELDFALYDLYNQTFWNLITMQDGFAKELKTFKVISKRINEFCGPLHQMLQISYKEIWNIMRDNKSLTLNSTSYNDVFTVTTEDCVLMAVNEEVFRSIVITKQYPEVSNCL